MSGTKEAKKKELKRINELRLDKDQLKQISTAGCWTCLFCKRACPMYEIGGGWLLNTPFGKIPSGD
jgi:formate hydrogenlyase subunit 6/NADH:ubiquinone oxidoreductase subunit I